MLAIQKYTINQNFIPNLPQEPFRNGVGQYEGICLHATAVYSDTPEGERQYETQHWQDAFVHGFVGHDEILQVADTNYISYGCCHTGNQFLLNLEQTQSHDHNIFLATYDRWVWTAAYWLFQRKLGVQDKVTLWSHAEVSNTYHESDHQDPLAYLAEHGKAWADVVNDVLAYYNQFEIESGITPTNNISVEDEENMAMNLTDYEWQMLNNIFGQRYNSGQITDWTWMQKIHSKALTGAELAFLSCVIEARKDNLSTDANSYGMGQ